MDPESSLLDWVLCRFPDTSRSRAKQWILQGRVRVGGQIIRKPHFPLSDPGPALELLKQNELQLIPEAGWQIHPLVQLLYIDSALAVVNKGAGLISVPGSNRVESALSILSDFLSGRIKPRSLASARLPSAYRNLYCLPVHRLDQYTTGVFCMACNPEAREHLIDQVRSHTMIREYVAFAEGFPKSAAGTWVHWLQLSHDQMRQQVVPNPKGKSTGTRQEAAVEAITHFEVIDQYEMASGPKRISKLRLTLETGCKHQIRVQAAHAGTPLIGDRLYNPNYAPRSNPKPIVEFSRQALHAQRLTLKHPDHPNEVKSWTAEMPRDLCQLETLLRSKRAKFTS